MCARYAADPKKNFYQFGKWANLAYCGAGAYPCGSIAGTPGYMCAQQLLRELGKVDPNRAIHRQAVVGVGQ